MTMLTGYPMTGWERWLRPAMAAALFALAGMLAAAEAVAGDARGESRTVEAGNAGVACIWRGHTRSGAEIMFRPHLGCLSSSCTTPLEQSFTAKVTQDPRPEIAMTSRFVARIATGQVICTTDCGGAGGASTLLADLPPGIYRLTLGGHEIGELDTGKLKGDPHNRLCFGRRPGE